jgi:hypothetical protein
MGHCFFNEEMTTALVVWCNKSRDSPGGIQVKKSVFVEIKSGISLTDLRRLFCILFKIMKKA